MEPEQILEQLNKRITNRVKQLALSVTSGGVDNMEKYKYMMGQAHAYFKISQDISNLLNKKEQNEKGTVINLNTK